MALIDNLISYWKFDESSGNAADAHGSNTLSNNNSAPFTTGKLNNAADLEAGFNQHFSIADGSQSGLDFSDALTFSAWVRLESVGANNTIINKRTGTGNQRSYTFYVTSNTAINFIWYTNGSTIGGNLSVAWTPSTATWYHVAITKSGTSVKFYVNGAQQGTTQTGSNATIYNGTADFKIGVEDASDNPFDGLMDEVGVWS